MNTTSLILGNFCSFLAMVSDSFSATRKTAKEVLLVQSLSQVIYCAATFFLKGYSSCVQNLVSILRNIVAIRKIESKAVEWFLVALGVVLGILWNNLGLVGLLPVLANLEYTLAVFRFKDNDRALKIAYAVCIAMFAVFNVCIWNFVGVIANLVVLSTTLAMVFRQKKAA